MFERVFPEYILRARNNYNYWTKGKSGLTKWDALILPVKNVLIDFVYQSYTKDERPMMAGADDNKNELINYIKSNTVLINVYTFQIERETRNHATITDKRISDMTENRIKEISLMMNSR